MSAEVQITSEPFGTTSHGSPVDLYTLTNGAIRVQAITYGARVVSIEAPDRHGVSENISLGYADLPGYEADTGYLGVLVGRYANRLAKGTFSLNGTVHHVPPNNGENALHGGAGGFAGKIWAAHPIPGGVEMSLTSPDGEMGFPGGLTVRCRYTLEDASFRCDIFAETTADTIVNLTNHSYFNLAGEGNGTIEDHVVQIHADSFLPVSGTQIPTGELRPVEGTAFDFRRPGAVKLQIEDDDEQLRYCGGYDHTFVLNGVQGRLRPVASVHQPDSGRRLTVHTTQPGAHFYTGNSLPGTTRGTNGKLIARRGGLCLETQHFPDSANHPNFPTTVLRRGETFHHTTVYALDVVG